jgi:hypothetical protein
MSLLTHPHPNPPAPPALSLCVPVATGRVPRGLRVLLLLCEFLLLLWCVCAAAAAAAAVCGYCCCCAPPGAGASAAASAAAAAAAAAWSEVARLVAREAFLMGEANKAADRAAAAGQSHAEAVRSLKEANAATIKRLRTEHADAYV